MGKIVDIKTFKLKKHLLKSLDQSTVSKINQYSNYKPYDVNKDCYVMYDNNDVIVCNQEAVKNWKKAGFKIWGIAKNQEELDELIDEATE